MRQVNFFGTKGGTEGKEGLCPFGGVPLGISIADDVFGTGMVSQMMNVLETDWECCNGFESLCRL